MKHSSLVVIALLHVLYAGAADSIYSFRFRNDVTITVDRAGLMDNKPTQLIIYALPNGNTTAQTMGKQLSDGDDWHFDIQHIRAQTAFIRAVDTFFNYIIVYIENDQKSWPAWTNRYYGQKLATQIIDTIVKVVDLPLANIHLSSHSGGGAFICDYIKQEGHIPDNIGRISFIDSDYRYDSTYTPAFIKYLESPGHFLNVFAYNDSIALLNGEPFVSPTGGTWYRTKLMLQHLAGKFPFVMTKRGDLAWYHSNSKSIINIFLLDNPERKILHTRQVELNGFIHSVFAGTAFENKGYSYMGERAYENYITP